MNRSMDNRQTRPAPLRTIRRPENGRWPNIYLRHDSFRRCWLDFFGFTLLIPPITPEWIQLSATVQTTDPTAPGMHTTSHVLLKLNLICIAVYPDSQLFRYLYRVWGNHRRNYDHLGSLAMMKLFIETDLFLENAHIGFTH
jgi:hypothetical protein